MGLGDTGVSPSWKRPGFVAKLVFGSGAVGAGSQRLRCLLVGMKTSSGSMTADSDVLRVTSEEDVDALAGPGSQLARMAYKALKVPSIELWIAAVTEPGAGTQATATLVLSGTLTSGGTLRFRIAGKTVVVSVGATDLLDTIGANIAAAFNANTKLPVTAAYNAGADTVTITSKNKGTSQRDWILYWDTSNKAETVAGLAIAMTGSAAVNTNGVRLGAAGSGTGSEDVTTLLTKLEVDRYARIAVGHNDATNAALWETHVNTKGNQTTLLLEQLLFGHNGTLVAAQSLAQTTLNHFLSEVVWTRNGESHPAEDAAMVAAIRSVTEQRNPVPDYNGYELEHLPPQMFPADIPKPAEEDTALNNGVTPLTTVNGTRRIVRAITTYCLNGAAQDERCLDVRDPTMTQYGVLDLKAMWDSEFRPQNPNVGPNPEEGDDELPPPGTAYPDLWTTAVAARQEQWYRDGFTQYRPRGEWAPVSTFVEAGGYIASDVQIPVKLLHNRIDVVARQVKNLA